MEIQRLPVVFAGHGSPMIAIEESRFRKGIREMGEKIGRPGAILAISAHWMTKGVRIRTAEDNPQINDMYGFPKELYEIHYEPPGDELLAEQVLSLLDGTASEDNTWGIDHGIWTVLCNMYPGADIPVVMMSTPTDYTPSEILKIGKKLKGLSEEGVLILASGNVVHNLRKVDWRNPDGAPWAYAFDAYIKNSILTGNETQLLEADQLSSYAKAVPTPENFYPLLAAAGAAEGRKAEVWNEGCELGSLSMTSYLFV
ncbi:MAG: class III extradiol ring-cleavage dioxygenase [Eubacteriales bacterium]|nr:class III extradiol ring-cleavage dioxygenase [Eubacteriales bacterium]